MSRIRTLKPEWLEDERLVECSLAARVLSVGLILLADDYGNGRAGLRALAGRVGLTPDETQAALLELVAISYVHVYEHEGQRYYSIRNWSKHQRVDKPGAALVPGPDGNRRSSSRQCRDSAVAPENQGDSPSAQEVRTQGDSPSAAQPETQGEDPSAPQVAGIAEEFPEPATVATVSRHCPGTAVPDLDLYQDLDLDLDHDRDLDRDQRAGAREASPDGLTSGVVNVWGAYVEAWRRHRGSGPEPKLTDARRGLIKARLREHAAATLAAACRGVWLSQWHREHNQTAIESALKDAAAVERFAGELERSKPKRARPRAEEPAAPSGPVLEPEAAARAARQVSALIGGIGRGGA